MDPAWYGSLSIRPSSQQADDRGDPRIEQQSAIVQGTGTSTGTAISQDIWYQHSRTGISIDTATNQVFGISTSTSTPSCNDRVKRVMTELRAVKIDGLRRRDVDRGSDLFQLPTQGIGPAQGCWSCAIVQSVASQRTVAGASYVSEAANEDAVVLRGPQFAGLVVIPRLCISGLEQLPPLRSCPCPRCSPTCDALGSPGESRLYKPNRGPYRSVGTRGPCVVSGVTERLR